MEESKNLYVSRMIESANRFVSEKNYDSAIVCLANALSMGSTNKEVIDLKAEYDSAKVKAQEETDAKNKAFSEASAKIVNEDTKKRIEEGNAKYREEVEKYKSQKIVDSNGKQVWKVYIKGSSFHFKATYNGTGNFIVTLSDSNQDLVATIANEIGEFVSDKTVSAPYVGWYYLEILASDGRWSGSWQ